MPGTVCVSTDRKGPMRARITHAALLTGLMLAGCSSSSPAAAPSAPATVRPTPSPAPAVRFTAPAEVNGLPRAKAAKWLKRPKSQADFFRKRVVRSTGTLAAAYLDPANPAEVIEISAAAGEVAAPAVTLRQITVMTADLEDVRPADPGTADGVGTCGVSRRHDPAVVTVCHWAEPGGIGAVTIWSLKDRRKSFAGIRGQI
jgi:hypothetical protein